MLAFYTITDIEEFKKAVIAYVESESLFFFLFESIVIYWGVTYVG